MPVRRLARLSVALAALWLLAGVAAAPAGAAVDPPPPLAPPGLDLGELGRAVAGALVAQFDAWLAQWLGGSAPAVVLRAFLHGLGLLGQRALSGLADANAASGMAVRLDPDITLGDETVRRVWGNARTVFNGLVGVGVVATGFAVLLRFGGVNAMEVGQLLPRVLLGAVLVNGSLEGLRGLLDASNGANAFLVGSGAQDFSRGAVEQLPPGEAGGLLVLIAAMAVLLFVQRFLLHAVLVVLAMSAPLALACWVIPMWAQWFWRWLTVLVGVVVVSAFQVMLMAAGAGMLSRVVARSDDLDTQRLLTGGVALGVLALATGVPGLLGLGLVGGTTLGLARRGVAAAANWTTATKAPPTAVAPAATAAGGSASAPTASASPLGAAGGGPAVDDVTDAEFVPRAGGLAQRGGAAPIVVYQPIRSVPTAALAAADRPALAPPDYLKE